MFIVGVICDRCNEMSCWEGHYAKKICGSLCTKKRMEHWKTVFMSKLQKRIKER